MQRLLLDHLPGGIYYSVTDAMVEETLSVPTTNVNPERDFAMLDRLMSEKPNATHIALESLICGIAGENRPSGAKTQK